MLVLSLLVIGGTLVSAQGQSPQRQLSFINFTDHNLQKIERRNSDGI